MLDRLDKEMCEAVINGFNPDYSISENPDHSGKYATNCGTWDIGDINISRDVNLYPAYCPYCGRKLSYWNFNDFIQSPIYTTATNEQNVK